MNTKLEYAKKKFDLVNQYKKDHPKYKEKIKAYAIEQAKELKN